MYSVVHENLQVHIWQQLHGWS